ncbi:hypothetical protein ALCH109712_07120 [Alkalicoccus chagannorensis]
MFPAGFCCVDMTVGVLIEADGVARCSRRHFGQKVLRGLVRGSVPCVRIVLCLPDREMVKAGGDAGRPENGYRPQRGRCPH